MISPGKDLQSDEFVGVATPSTLLARAGLISPSGVHPSTCTDAGGRRNGEFGIFTRLALRPFLSLWCLLQDCSALSEVQRTSVARAALPAPSELLAPVAQAISTRLPSYYVDTPRDMQTRKFFARARVRQNAEFCGISKTYCGSTNTCKAIR
jgi:hypothetical protein